MSRADSKIEVRGLVPAWQHCGTLGAGKGKVPDAGAAARHRASSLKAEVEGGTMMGTCHKAPFTKGLVQLAKNPLLRGVLGPCVTLQEVQGGRSPRGRAEK